MVRVVWLGIGIIVIAAVSFGWHWIVPPKEILVGDVHEAVNQPVPQKTKEELIADALEKSKDIRGLYMTAEVANDQGSAATRLRNNILRLATSTEINGVVIDVKEVCGPEYNPDSLEKLLDTLHQNNVWAIARIVTFKDASQIDTHPEWYLKRKKALRVPDNCANKKYLRAHPARNQPSETAAVPLAEWISNGARTADGKKPDVILWRDDKGGYWLDPASDGARNYIVDLGKKMIDLGFDELQFDYVRFPSDGDVQNAQYPSWDGNTPKYVVMKSFFEFLNKNLKAYKPNIMLSADMFGYAAIRAGDIGIGQRLDDIGDNFDYVSFMVYPSHYYSGLYLPADPVYNLTAVSMNAIQARTHPDTIVYRSLLFAREFLDGVLSTSTVTDFKKTATTVPEAIVNPMPRSHVRLRPWLEDFFHDQDMVAGRPYGAQKVDMQIKAAEQVEPHGWLLWNASNNYTEAALKKN